MALSVSSARGSDGPLQLWQSELAEHGATWRIQRHAICAALITNLKQFVSAVRGSRDLQGQSETQIELPGRKPRL